MKLCNLETQKNHRGKELRDRKGGEKHLTAIFSNWVTTIAPRCGLAVILWLLPLSYPFLPAAKALYWDSH